MKFKGTKGNWEVIELDIIDFKQISIASDGRESVLAHIYLPKHIIDEEAKNNAKLIAAAPELLEALQYAINSMTIADEIEFQDEIKQAEKAINKTLN